MKHFPCKVFHVDALTASITILILICSGRVYRPMHSACVMIRMDVSGVSNEGGLHVCREGHGAKPNVSRIRALVYDWPRHKFVAYLIPNAVSLDVCRIIGANFLKRISDYGSHRNNDGFVNVSQIGATQFTKTSEEYAHECVETRSDVFSLFDGVKLPSEVFLNESVEKAVISADKSASLRPANFAGEEACLCSTRIWKNLGNLSLEAHDDCAQLSMAKRFGSEIGNITSVIAQNLTVSAPEEGGILRIWNLAPDSSMRAALNLTETGYPYPKEITDDLEYLDIPTKTGDIVFFAANFLHGVTAVNAGTRITMGRFLGALPNGEIVYWT